MARQKRMPNVIPRSPQRGFVNFLRELTRERGITAKDFAQQVGVHRSRMQQIMAQIGPPPVPEIVDRIALALGLDEVQRHTLIWLALRDGVDPNIRSLIEGYEWMLSRSDRKGIPRPQLPAQLSDIIEAATFASAKRELAIRNSSHPIHVLVHDENGRMAESLEDGWLMLVEPVGMFGKEEFVERAVDKIVLINYQRRSRIGWLRHHRRRLELHDDQGESLLTDADEKTIPIARKGKAEPNMSRFQGLIPEVTLNEIAELRRQARHERVDQDWFCTP